MGKKEHMFEQITVESVMEQAAQIAAWVLAMQADLRVKAWQELVSVDVWWVKLTIVAYVVFRTVDVLRRWLRRLGFGHPR